MPREMFVVSKGVEHEPFAAREVKLMLAIAVPGPVRAPLYRFSGSR